MYFEKKLPFWTLLQDKNKLDLYQVPWIPWWIRWWVYVSALISRPLSPLIQPYTNGILLGILGISLGYDIVLSSSSTETNCLLFTLPTENPEVCTRTAPVARLTGCLNFPGNWKVVLMRLVKGLFESFWSCEGHPNIFSGFILYVFPGNLNISELPSQHCFETNDFPKFPQVDKNMDRILPFPPI